MGQPKKLALIIECGMIPSLSDNGFVVLNELENYVLAPAYSHTMYTMRTVVQ